MTQHGAMRIAVVLILGFTAAVLVGVPASAAPVPKHLMKESEKTEEAKLKGRWKLETVSPAELKQAIEITLEFNGNKMTGISKEGAISATIKLDIVDGVKRLAFTDTKVVNGMGQTTLEEDLKCGYSIDGDKLTLAMTIGGNEQKAVDPAKAGANDIVLVFTRIKEKN